MFRESQTLRIEVVMHEAEGPIGKEICGCINVSCVFRPKRQSGVRETMGRYVWDGGCEDG